MKAILHTKYGPPEELKMGEVDKPVPEDNEVLMREIGSFVAKQLMTQIPYDLTVVGEHMVPWPSGCDLYENQKKWGWRPDKEFPYYCGEDEGEVVISFPEEEAWVIMRAKAVVSTKQDLQDLNIEISQFTQICIKI